MALTIVNNNLNPYAASAAGGGGVRGNAASLSITMTTITLDGSYATGGITLTPAQLGLTDAVLCGWVVVRTAVATASPSNGTLDCTSISAPKLKLVAAGALAELAAGAGSGAVLDVYALGY
jgi:hypothetical protein